MPKAETVRVFIWNSYPGRFPGERGISTTTGLTFVDRDGRIAKLARQITVTEARKRTASIKAITEPGILRHVWRLVEDFSSGKELRLQRLAISLTMEQLRKKPLDAEWEIAHSAGPFHRLEAREVSATLNKFGSASHIFFSVLEPKPSIRDAPVFFDPGEGINEPSPSDG